MEQRRMFYLQWDSTNDCNLRCSHCYHNREGWKHASHQQDASKLMDFGEVKEMINDLYETSVRWNFRPRLHISGGEPLMRSDLMDILGYTYDKGIETRLLTNGTLITKRKATELKKRGIESLQISLDGAKETHNIIRKRHYAYDKAIEGIKNCVCKGITVTVCMTAMQSNKDELEQVVIASINAGAKVVGARAYIPSRVLGANDPEFLGAEETYNLYKEIRKLSEKYGGQIKISESEVLWHLFYEDNFIKENARAEDRYFSGCSAGFTGISVLSDGTALPCRSLPIPIGHIKEGIVNLFLEKEVMKNLRDFDKLRNYGCCEHVNYCRGCRAIAYAVTGDYMAKDPMCFKSFIKPEDKIRTKDI